MKISYIYLFFIISIQALSAQAPAISWQKSMGGSYYDKAQSIIELSDGGYLIAGNSQSSNQDLVFNHGMFDWWIVRISNTGETIWKKTFGGTLNDYARQVIKTSDGNFLCIGETQSNNGDVANYIDQIDFWVIKIDLLGNIIWEKCFGGTGIDRAYSACTTNDGNLMIAGSSESGTPYINNNHGLSDFLLFKINPQGNIIWQQTYGGSGFDICKSIKKTSTGAYVLCGNSNSENGNITNNKGGQDIWIVKIDANGVLQWQLNVGGSSDDFANAIIEDKNGDFVIVGETYSTNEDAIENHSIGFTRDFFAVKISAHGQKLWTRCYGGTGNEYARGIIETFGDEYVIVGESYSNDLQAPNNKGSADFWLIKTSSGDGELIWQKKYGSNGHDEPNDLILTFDNNFVFVGNTFPVGELGDVSVHYGDDDMWIVKLANNDCVKNLSLLSDMIYGNRTFKSTEKIIGGAKIMDASSNIIYSAGKNIVLQNGFSIHSGAIFEAKIEGCN